MSELRGDRGGEGTKERVSTKGRDTNGGGQSPANNTQDESEGIFVQPLIATGSSNLDNGSARGTEGGGGAGSHAGAAEACIKWR